MVMQDEVADAVRSAAEGHEAAWDYLVDRFSGLVWSIARGLGLSYADAADVSQTTWLRLVEHLARLREPERVGAWLASTARRECLGVLRRAGRQIPTGDQTDLESAGPELLSEPVDALLLASERDTALWRAFGGLPSRCRTLLRVLMTDPRPSYEEISAALEVPIGSIGPTRGRCLERLRWLVERAGISADAWDRP